MDFSDNNTPDYADNIGRLMHMSNDQNELNLLQHMAGLKALLDVLPEDTEHFSQHTIENYLWVIEMLLQNVYDHLVDQTGSEE